MFKLVILRHGQSIWNKKGIFTGWVDVGLSRRGKKESKEAGRILKENGFIFNIAFCSVLKRAKQTLEIVLKEMDIKRIPIKTSWRLNERHYGALQGLKKKDVLKKYGEKQFIAWRRSFGIRPPASTCQDKFCSGDTPLTESLQDTLERVLPYWQEEIEPVIKSDKKVLISAHGSTSRALVTMLDNLSNKEIEKLNIPTGIPLVYELNPDLKPLKSYYLGDAEEVRKAAQEVAVQGKI